MLTASSGPLGATNVAPGYKPHDGASLANAWPAAEDLETFGCQIEALISPT
jgi:hypothetical protein